MDAKTIKSLIKAAGNALIKQQQMEKLTEMINQNIFKPKEIYQDAVASAIISAKEAAEQAVSILSSWGLEGSKPEIIKHNTELLQCVKQNDKIKNIAKYLGKYRKILGLY